jgi:hypothetical protein
VQFASLELPVSPGPGPGPGTSGYHLPFIDDSSAFNVGIAVTVGVGVTLHIFNFWFDR